MSPVQILAFVGLLVALSVAAQQFDPDYLYVDEDVGQVEDLNPSDQDIHARWKRDATVDASWKLPQSDLLRKAKSMVGGYKTLPPNLKQAIEDGDFSKVTARDIQDVNVTILEYIPPQVFEKVDLPIMTEFIQKYMVKNRPIALGRLVEAGGNRLLANYLLDKIVKNGGIKDENEEAANVLLYSAMSKMGAKGGISDETVNLLLREGLLESVSKKQLMKVKDAYSAKSLLNGLADKYRKPERRNELDDKTLITELVRAGYGSPDVNWTQDNLRTMDSHINVLPAAVLKQTKPDLVIQPQAIKLLSEAKFETPLQFISIADIYLRKIEIPVNQDGIGNKQHIDNVAKSLGRLAAFLPPGITREADIQSIIISNSDRLGIPAPLKAITAYYEARLKSRAYKKLTDLKPVDFQSIQASILKFSPPEVIKLGISQQVAITPDILTEIARSGSGLPGSKQAKAQSPFLRGVRSQLASYAVQSFGVASGRGKKVDYSKLPAAYYGALGMKEMEKISGNDIDTAINNLKDDPDTLDEGQKTLLLKKLKDNRGGQDVNIPPELSSFRQRRKGESFPPGILEDLPWDSEFRLAFGAGNDKRRLSSYELKKSPYLLGTLVPNQIESLELEELPTILNILRKSRDGPQPPALKALFMRLVEYIRLKTADNHSDDKQLLKHLTAAEISKLPASVLIYFINPSETKKLPDEVKKELLVALGELSTKDYAIVPRKTRELVVSLGLEALEKSVDPKKNLSVSELAIFGRGVSDLPADKIKRLCPASTELALEIIQGTADDGLKQRACLKPDQRKAWRDQIILNYGSPESWSPANVSTLCCSLQLLNEDDLVKVKKEGMAACKCASDLPPPSHLAEQKKSLDIACKYDLGKDHDSARRIFDRIKSERSLDIEDLETHIAQTSSGGSHKDAHAHAGHEGAGRVLTCNALRLVGSAAAFESKVLETLQAKDMNNCLYELGTEKLSGKNARIIWSKLVESWNNSIDKIPAESFRLANHILSSVNEGEIAKLNFTDHDIVAAFGRPLGFSKSVLRKLASHFEAAVKYPLERYYTRDLIIAKNFLCGVDNDKLAKINVNNFREALPALRSIEGSCEQSKLSTLAKLVILPALFGETSKWDSADVRGIGILLKGLSAADLKKIPPEAFLGVTPTVAEALTFDTLKELGTDQLRFLPRFTAQAVNSDQISQLHGSARATLDSVSQGPLITNKSVNLRSATSIIATALVFFLSMAFVN